MTESTTTKEVFNELLQSIKVRIAKTESNSDLLQLCNALNALMVNKDKVA